MTLLFKRSRFKVEIGIESCLHCIDIYKDDCIKQPSCSERHSVTKCYTHCKKSWKISIWMSSLFKIMFACMPGWLLIYLLVLTISSFTSSSPSYFYKGNKIFCATTLKGKGSCTQCYCLLRRKCPSLLKKRIFNHTYKVVSGLTLIVKYYWAYQPLQEGTSIGTHKVVSGLTLIVVFVELWVPDWVVPELIQAWKTFKE